MHASTTVVVYTATPKKRYYTPFGLGEARSYDRRPRSTILQINQRTKVVDSYEYPTIPLLELFLPSNGDSLCTTDSIILRDSEMVTVGILQLVFRGRADPSR